MMSYASIVRAALVTLLAIGCCGTASAQNVIHIQNVYRPEQQIHIERGPVESSPAQPGWLSAQWIFEPVAGTNYVRIRNIWTGTYLNVETGTLQATPVEPGWLSAQWAIEPGPGGAGNYRIQNRWTEAYLHTENGTLEIGEIQPGWLSALWMLPGYSQGAPATQPASSEPEHTQVVLPQEGETQCVKNLAGIIANVRWYRPTDFVADPANPATFKLSDSARPTQTDNIVITQRSCINEDVRMVAIVSVEGHEIATASVKIATGTIIAVGGAVACVGTEGAACPAVVAGLTTLASGGAEFIPDAVDVFYTGAPGLLELSGSAFNPTATETRPWGTGALEGQRCDSNADCRNNQCGRATAAENAPKVCCPAGSTALPYAGYDYCNNMPKGSVCWSDAQCASDYCEGNASGLQRGRCR